MTIKIYFFEHDEHSFSEKFKLNQRGIFLTILFFIISVFSLIPTTSRAQACSTIGSTQLVFGQYDPIAEYPLDIATTIEFNCPPAFRGRVNGGRFFFIKKNRSTSKPMPMMFF